MSVDTGLIVRTHKRGISFYEICLSSFHRDYLETLPKTATSEDVSKKIKELNQKLEMECGEGYEAIFYEDWKTRYPEGVTKKAIKEIKSNTKSEIREALDKLRVFQKALKINKIV